MEISEGALMTRLTIIAVTVSLIGGGLTWLDSRHASASDVSALSISIDKERLSRLEFEIEELERIYKGIKRMTVEEQSTPDVESRVVELETRRARYLRKREELLLEMGVK